MIRITLSIDSSCPPSVHVFRKEKIVLGGDPDQVDLVLPGSSFPSHLAILSQGGVFVLVNLAHDPFALLNGHPFGKKIVNSGDIVLLDQTTLLIEVLEETQVRSAPDEEEVAVFSIPTPNACEQASSHRFIPVEEGASTPSPDRRKGGQKLRYCLLFTLLLALVLLSWGVRRSFESTEQENIAAQGIADVAMVLTYAQLLHYVPDNHNWSDLEFLKHHLGELLPSHASYANSLNPQGQFGASPYVLRLYVNQDQSRFIVIAQPVITDIWSLGWGQTMLVIDSASMELRRVRDWKNLNRLLAASDPFADAHWKELTDLLASEESIAPSVFGQGDGRGSFTTPAELAERAPGADYFLYNAPRYHRLGLPMIQKILGGVRSDRGMAALCRELDGCKRFSSMVLYLSENEQDAKTLRRRLDEVAPQNSFLIGYLRCNPKNGGVESFLTEDAWTEQVAQTAPESYPAQHLKDWSKLIEPATSRMTAFLEREKMRPSPDFRQQWAEEVGHYQTLHDAIVQQLGVPAQHRTDCSWHFLRKVHDALSMPHQRAHIAFLRLGGHAPQDGLTTQATSRE